MSTASLELLQRALLLVRSGVPAGELLQRLDPYVAAVWPECLLAVHPGTPPVLEVRCPTETLTIHPGEAAPHSSAFDAVQVQAAAALAEVLAEADARSELFRKVVRSNAWLARLDDLSRVISQQTDVESIVSVTAEGLNGLCGVVALGLYLVDADRPTLMASHGDAAHFPSTVQVLGATGRTLLGRPEDETLELGTSVGPNGSHRLVALLHGQDGLEGLLVSVRPATLSEWPEDAIPLVHAAAGHLASAVRNAQLVEEMRRLAAYDDLTGLAGRRHFMTELDREFDRARRESRPLSVLMVDADHFKGINDGFGHAGGDAVLLVLADELRKNTRTLDVVGRLGGEEFGVLLPGADFEIVQLVAERLRSAVSRVKIPWRDEFITVTVSVGAATWDRVCAPDVLLEVADNALYRAKHGGRNRVVSQITMDAIDALVSEG
jgi:diguanylate cyclase (GGDEF)-like protein